jgi:hypothetical protein
MSPRSCAIALTLLLAAPAAASADGLPVPVENAGPTGVVSPDGTIRYVALPAGKGTVVEAVETKSGRILEWKRLRGDFTIPVVALDGTPAGLSHDGRTLVLIRPRAGFPRASTDLVVIGTRQLRLRRTVHLRGDFSFDAMSPDGKTTFLVNYVDPRNVNRYRVRTLDTATGELSPRPIVDPEEPPDEMRGLPLTRASSADGRWHYTLYDGAGKHPFVHALDVGAGKAKCIDLPPFPNVDEYAIRMRLSDGGRVLRVGSFATVDTRSFEVTPASARAAVRATKTGEESPGSPSAVWVAIAGALLLGGGLALSLRSRRGRRRTAAAR